jgi:hypothetical protein
VYRLGSVLFLCTVHISDVPSAKCSVSVKSKHFYGSSECNLLAVLNPVGPKPRVKQSMVQIVWEKFEFPLDVMYRGRDGQYITSLFFFLLLLLLLFSLVF